MADEPHQELVIIKRHGGSHEGHHGGAWKIAFADFMTAMMALFLVLWLISATTPKMRIVIARYFNPVKLAEVAAEKKGLNDPTGAGPTHSSPKGEESKDKRFELPPLQEKRALFDIGGQPTHSESALFRDPYAVLSEIVSQSGRADGSQGQMKSGNDSKAAPVTPDNNEAFRDPFATIPQTEPQQVVPDTNEPSHATSSTAATVASDGKEASNNGAGAKAAMPGSGDGKSDANQAVSANILGQATKLEAGGVKSGDLEQASAAASLGKDKIASTAKGASKTSNQAHGTADQSASQQAADAKAGEADAAKLRTELANAVHKDAASSNIPNVEVKSTDEGVLISLTDGNNYAMFAVGSAEPQAKTIEVMEKVAQLLKNRQGLIVVRGHTDGRPYKSAAYDNWQLSAARAQMAHYMLVRGGLDEKRIDRIEGYADHRLKVPNDALAAENRRIEILLRKDKS